MGKQFIILSLWSVRAVWEAARASLLERQSESRAWASLPAGEAALWGLTIKLGCLLPSPYYRLREVSVSEVWQLDSTRDSSCLSCQNQLQVNTGIVPFAEVCHITLFFGFEVPQRWKIITSIHLPSGKLAETSK